MSFQMVHMEVAFRLLEFLPNIENKADYLLGSVAPDSVHMKDDYQLSDKIRTHLFDGCGVWATTGDYQKWQSNITGFWNKNKEKQLSQSEMDFVAGICVHVITDYENSLILWDPYRVKYGKDGVVNPDFYQVYNAEQYAIDQWLYQNSPHREEIRKLLQDGQGHELDGFLNLKDIEKQKDWMLHHQYADKLKAISNYEYMNSSIIEDFIQYNVATIRRYMGDTP